VLVATGSGVAATGSGVTVVSSLFSPTTFLVKSPTVLDNISQVDGAAGVVVGVVVVADESGVSPPPRCLRRLKVFFVLAILSYIK